MHVNLSIELGKPEVWLDCHEQSGRYCFTKNTDKKQNPKIGTGKCFKFHQIFVIRIGKCMYVCHMLWHIGADI